MNVLILFLTLVSAMECLSFEAKNNINTSKELVNDFEEDSSDHVNSRIKKESKDENYKAKLVKRKHDSHTHRVGGTADKAYYTYYSNHPSSRHSAWSFHQFQHGIPAHWSESMYDNNKMRRRGFNY